MNNLVIHVASTLVDTAFPISPAEYGFRTPNYSNCLPLLRLLAPMAYAEPSQASRKEAEDNA